MIEPFEISIAEQQIIDLHRRLQSVRWPCAVRGYGWDEGTDQRYLRDFVDYWRDGHDWREREALLNQLPHYITGVDGTALHFIHARGEGGSPIPLLLLHGWPSSFVQMTQIIPLLTQAREDGAPTFDVIAASMPGYPFTTPPALPGMHFGRIADLLVRLMVEKLGYGSFMGRGSDQGGLALHQIGLKYPERLIGLHRSGITPFATQPIADLSQEEIAYQSAVAKWAKRETSYAQLQGLRPETLTPALADSPVALASWFLEKFQRWGDCRDGLDAQFGRERLADNLSLHWFANSAAPATRLYLEAGRAPAVAGRVEVPTAVMMPLCDGVTVPAPRAWCERSYNVVRWTIMERGGHFPEWECPVVVADDLRAFAAMLA